MNKEQEIEEMANALKAYGNGRIVGTQIVARELVNAGYGNIKRALQELLSKILSQENEICHYDEDFKDKTVVDSYLIKKSFDELLKKYGND